MTKYGSLIDGSIDLEKEEVYDLFTEYFNNPSMTKIKEAGDFSIYMTKLDSLLLVEYKYIVVMVSRDSKPIKTQEKLSNLKWKSIQTRFLSDMYNIPKHDYPKKKTPFSIKKIFLIERDDNQSKYSCEDIPITVTLLHSNQEFCDYMDTGILIRAIETFKTVITFNK